MDFIVIQEFQPPELEHDYSKFLSSKSTYREKISSDFHCQQPWQRVVVTNQGEVCPCCAFFRTELSLGNLKDNSIHHYWNSPEMKKLRLIHKNVNFIENDWCKKCVNSMFGIFDNSEKLININ